MKGRAGTKKKKTLKSLCEECSARCCRYFALQIDTPRTKEDFEKLRWYISHKAVTLFVEKRKWYLDVANECRYITEDHRCSIYEKRPLVCREHSTYDCERQNDQFEHEEVFSSVEELDLFVEKRFRRKKRRRRS